MDQQQQQGLRPAGVINQAPIVVEGEVYKDIYGDILKGWDYRHFMCPAEPIQAMTNELKRIGAFGWEVCGMLGVDTADGTGQVIVFIKRVKSGAPLGFPEQGGYVESGTGQAGRVQEETPSVEPWSLGD